MFRRMIRRYPVNDVVPGMEIGKIVLTDNGLIALGEGTILTATLIEKLKVWGVSFVDILEVTVDTAQEKPVAVNPDISVSSGGKAIIKEYRGVTKEIKKIFEVTRLARGIPLPLFRDVAVEAVEPLVNTIGVINQLQMVKQADDYLFQHSINVAVISAIIAKWLGYTIIEQREMILCGLLHDVGKTQVSADILKKAGKLSDGELQAARLHTVYGYQMAKDRKDLDLGISLGILQHHERTDGSGYPFGISGEKIHPYAKIIAVADIYDAMTSDRAYNSKATPFMVAETLVEEMYGRLDPTICAIFLNNLRDYFIGNTVELNDGREAEVVYIGQYIGARPVIRTKDGVFIDLEKNKDIAITRLVRA